MIPHEGVHGRAVEERFVLIPGSYHTRLHEVMKIIILYCSNLKWSNVYIYRQ